MCYEKVRAHIDTLKRNGIFGVIPSPIFALPRASVSYAPALSAIPPSFDERDWDMSLRDGAIYVYLALGFVANVAAFVFNWHPSAIAIGVPALGGALALWLYPPDQDGR